MEQKLHTPEGVRDIYNRECAIKLALQKKLNTVLHLYGYQDIQTPTFEYFDVFRKEIGSTSIRDLYKFFDREGNILALRPDITPSIARAVATLFETENFPIRLCYAGNTFINHSSYRGRLKENTQLGAELIGVDSIEADAEMLALSAQLLKTAGLKEFQLSVGHADFLRGLFEAANLEEDVMEEIRNLLLNRNLYGVQEVVEQHVADENLKQLFGLLTDVMLDKEKITAAKAWAADYPRVFHALTRLEELDELLEVYKIRKYVSYELAMISGFNYYTGIIFAGYTFGSGEAIVNGGRYDNLLQSFGKSAPSIGFAVVINQLMAALQRQNVRIPFENTTKWFIYSGQYRQDAIKDAQVLRSRGEQVELMPLTEQNTREVYETYAEQNHIQDIIFYM